MQGFIVIIGIIVLLGGYIFIKIKINNLRYRAEQHVLGGMGLGSANINAAINASQEQGALTKFLAENPSFTEKSLKDTIYAYALNIINGQNNNLMSPKVLEEMAKDSRLEIMRPMTFVRINLLAYRSNKMSAIAVFTDSKDEYQLMINLSIQNGQLYIESFDSMKGMTKGF